MENNLLEKSVTVRQMNEALQILEHTGDRPDVKLIIENLLLAISICMKENWSTFPFPYKIGEFILNVSYLHKGLQHNQQRSPTKQFSEVFTGRRT